MSSTKPTVIVHTWVSPCDKHWHAHIRMSYPSGKKSQRNSPPMLTKEAAQSELDERMAELRVRLDAIPGGRGEIVYRSGNPEAN